VNWRVTVTRSPSRAYNRELKSHRYTESLRSGQEWTEESPLHGVPLESVTVNWIVTVTRSPSRAYNRELKSHRYTESLRSGQGWTEESPLHGGPLESVTVNWRVTVTRSPSGVFQGWTEESPLHGVPLESVTVNWRVTVTRSPSGVFQGWTEESMKQNMYLRETRRRIQKETFVLRSFDQYKTRKILEITTSISQCSSCPLLSISLHKWLFPSQKVRGLVCNILSNLYRPEDDLHSPFTWCER